MSTNPAPLVQPTRTRQFLIAGKGFAFLALMSFIAAGSAIGPWVNQPPAFADNGQSPQAQPIDEVLGHVLLLRSGLLYRGPVTLSETGFQVELGHGSIMRFTTGQVEFMGDSDEHVYNYVRSGVAATDVRRHTDIATWCLRHSMFEQAEMQLSHLESIGCDERVINRLRRDLKLRQPAPAKTARQPQHGALSSASTPEADQLTRLLPQNLDSFVDPTSANRSPERVIGVAANTALPVRNRQQLEQLAEALPEHALRQFATAVQPRLTNGCTTAGCHLGVDDPFRLVRFERGAAIGRGMMLRNLSATIDLIDLENPDESELLAYMQTPHGGMLDAVYDPQSIHYQEVRNWIVYMHQATAQRPDARKAIVQQQRKTNSMPQTAAKEPIGPPSHSGIALTSALEPLTPKVSPAPSPINPLQRPRATAEDPWDPGVFNRRYHKPDSANREKDQPR